MGIEKTFQIESTKLVGAETSLINFFFINSKKMCTNQTGLKEVTRKISQIAKVSMQQAHTNQMDLKAETPRKFLE